MIDYQTLGYDQFLRKSPKQEALASDLQRLYESSVGAGTSQSAAQYFGSYPHDIPISSAQIFGPIRASEVTIVRGGDVTLDQGGNINFTRVTAPAAPVATLVTTGTGNVDAGAHLYAVTFVDANGETALGSPSNSVTADGTHKQVTVSFIATRTSKDITSRNIYRTKVGDTTRYYLLTSLADNATTTYTDNVADASLGVEQTGRANTTTSRILVDGTSALFFGGTNLGVGEFSIGNPLYLVNAYWNTSVGYSNLENITTGFGNTAVGTWVGDTLTTGNENTLLGVWAAYQLSTGSQNTVVGANTNSFALLTGSRNVFLGYRAGSQETGSDKLYIDNSNTTTPLIYGDFSTNAVTINGSLNVVGNYDGWTGISDTWTYASANTITVPTGAASKYSKGDKIKLTQTTVKYFYVVAVADTLLTVTAGSDYTVANAAITLPYYSKASNPLSFPSSFTWSVGYVYGGTLTVTTTTTNQARFHIVGNNCHFNLDFTAAFNGGAGNRVDVDYPITTISNLHGGGAHLYDGGDKAAMWYPSSTTKFSISRYDASNFTITGNEFNVQGFIEF